MKLKLVNYEVKWLKSFRQFGALKFVNCLISENKPFLIDGIDNIILCNYSTPKKESYVINSFLEFVHLVLSSTYLTRKGKELIGFLDDKRRVLEFALYFHVVTNLKTKGRYKYVLKISAINDDIEIMNETLYKLYIDAREGEILFDIVNGKIKSCCKEYNDMLIKNNINGDYKKSTLVSHVNKRIRLNLCEENLLSAKVMKLLENITESGYEGY